MSDDQIVRAQEMDEQSLKTDSEKDGWTTTSLDNQTVIDSGSHRIILEPLSGSSPQLRVKRSPDGKIEFLIIDFEKGVTSHRLNLTQWQQQHEAQLRQQSDNPHMCGDECECPPSDSELEEQMYGDLATELEDRQ
jgi:hypothetical protein